jgi:hypothetical protein
MEKMAKDILKELLAKDAAMLGAYAGQCADMDVNEIHFKKKNNRWHFKAKKDDKIILKDSFKSNKK